MIKTCIIFNLFYSIEHQPVDCNDQLFFVYFQSPYVFKSMIISFIPNGICYLILLCYFLYTLVAVVRRKQDEVIYKRIMISDS